MRVVQATDDGTWEVLLKYSRRKAYVKLTSGTMATIYIPGVCTFAMEKHSSGGWLMNKDLPAVNRWDLDKKDIYSKTDSLQHFLEELLAGRINKAMFDESDGSEM